MTINNSEKYILYNVKFINNDIIKIGIIGFIIKENENYNLEDIIKEIKLHVDILKKNGTNAIILLTNLKLNCRVNNLKLSIYQNTKQICDEFSNSNKTIFNVLKNITSIDAVIAANQNDMEIHHWEKGVPIMSSPSKGKYFNIMYLPFQKKGGKYFLNNAEIMIEGPNPLCEKVFNDTKICGNEINTYTKEEINFLWHDRKIYKDTNLKEKEKKLYGITD